jgi:hypothetical protein
VDTADELRLLQQDAQGALLATLVARRPGCQAGIQSTGEPPRPTRSDLCGY